MSITIEGVRYLTTTEVAKLKRVSRQAITGAIREKRLAARKTSLGSATTTYWIREDDARAFKPRAYPRRRRPPIACI